MAKILNYQLERLKRVGVNTHDVWQGAIVRLPGWIDDEEIGPYRPRAALWRSAETGLFHSGPPMRPDEVSTSHVLDALVDFAGNSDLAGYRPGRLQLTDPELAGFLGDTLADLGIVVTIAKRVPLVSDLLREMSLDLAGVGCLSSALQGENVDVNRMRSFADAAAVFFRAGLWNELDETDLIRLDQPAPEPELSWFVVLGASGTRRGLCFFGSVSDHEAFISTEDQSRLSQDTFSWMLTFGAITELPFPDADLWEDHDLPAAGAEAYPLVLCIDRLEKHHRPDARMLAFLEGLLRTLAAASIEDLDDGQLRHRAETADGAMALSLSLPSIFEPPPGRPPIETDITAFLARGEHAGEEHLTIADPARPPGARTPQTGKGTSSTRLARAQDIVSRALEAHGRTQLRLAREAIAVCPDCADAFLLLADRAPDVGRKLELCASAVDAALRALGPGAHQRYQGGFWGFLETRPYMRAVYALACALEETGRVEEAIGHFQTLLDLNPDDNMGARNPLLVRLLDLGRNDEAREIASRYREDQSALMAYGRALLAFRAGHKSVATRRLNEAVKINPSVVDYLIGSRELPEELPAYYTMGGEDEAVLCAAELSIAWTETPGARRWLAERRLAGGG